MIFPQLAVGEVNRATTTQNGVGGKSVNVAKALKELGEEPIATGLIGGRSGDSLAAFLEGRGVRIDFVQVSPPTRECITVIDHQTGTQTELVEESREVPPEAYAALLQKVRQHLPACRAVVMSGTLTPTAPQDFYATCASLAREAGLFAVVDATGPALLNALSQRPALVKPNQRELAATTGVDIDNSQKLFTAIRTLAEMGARNVVVTAGKNPTVASDGLHLWKIVNPSVLAINPIGSGDAFTAALVSRLLKGDDLGEACRWGAAAGAANTLSLMPGDFESKEVERLLPLVEVEPLGD